MLDNCLNDLVKMTTLSLSHYNKRTSYKIKSEITTSVYHLVFIYRRRKIQIKAMMRGGEA